MPFLALPFDRTHAKPRRGSYSLKGRVFLPSVCLLDSPFFRRRPNLYFFHHSFCKFKRERSENVFGKSDFHWPLVVLAEEWHCSLYANVQSSVPTMFLHFLLQTDGLQTDGSRLFRFLEPLVRNPVRRRVVSKKGGFGGCSPGTKTGTRVHSDVPPERGYNEGTFAKTTLLRNRPFISQCKMSFSVSVSAMNNGKSPGHRPGDPSEHKPGYPGHSWPVFKSFFKLICVFLA